MTFPIDQVLSLLEKEVRDYQVPVVDLIAAQTRDPFKVLVATILSARTKDEVTAAASKRLFSRVSTPGELAKLSVAELEKLIYPVGFFRNKARYLNQLPPVLTELFNGRIPDRVEDLVKLPGVGRKTANLVVAVAFGKPAICVDTHVHRIMNIWGYVTTSTPLQTEMVLRKQLPSEYWLKVNSILVAFGQGTCKPRLPHCDRCVVARFCPRIGVIPRKVASEGLRKTRDDRAVKRFVSWNVNGLRAAYKKGFLDSFHELDADIFALQEIKAMPEQLPEPLREVKGYHAIWYPAEKKGYSGTAVYTRIEPLEVIHGLGREEFDREGRVLTLEFDSFYFVNVYFPNAQPGLKRLDYKLVFNRAVRQHLDLLSARKTVVAGGDFNVAHREIDLANPASNVKNPGFTPEERAWVDEMIGAGYVDTFRLFNQDPGCYTWWSYRFNARARNIGWRIDYFLVDPASRDRIRGAAIHDEVAGSDHCPVSLTFT